MPPTNQAAWIPSKQAKPFKVSNAPYIPPGPGEVVVKNKAVAINPFDWVLQLIGPILASHIKYPFIFGTDIAGEIVEIGPDVKRFQVGDRVCGSATSIAKEVNRAAEGGFQLYTVMRQHMITKIPLHVKDEQACVLGLGVVTAAYGLFHTKYLGLDMPTVPAPAAHAHGEGDESGNSRTVIVTGGASSVGANAVQLAVSAGYQVISTSSPKNFEFVKSLGAAHVFDYRSKTIVDDMLRVIKGRELTGAYAIGDGAVEVCSAVMLKHDVNLTRKYIALAGAQLPAESLLTFWGKANFFLGMIFGMIKSKVSKWSTGIDVKFIMLEDLVNPDSVVAKVYTEFLPEALGKGQFVPAPPPEIVGHGLDKIQDALELQRQGVSGKKLVVTL